MSIEISVVMPVYNAAEWLPLSIPKVDDALAAAELEAAEIVVVDDGSTDGTGDAVRQVATRYPMRVVSQANGGRFLARTRGTDAATYDYVLFLDSRVFIDRHALAYVISRLRMKSDALVWVGHVNIDKSTLYARFWDAVAVIAWRRYFSDPRECSFGLDDLITIRRARAASSCRAGDQRGKQLVSGKYERLQDRERRHTTHSLHRSHAQDQRQSELFVHIPRARQL